jgi:hypothetical protein
MSKGVQILELIVTSQDVRSNNGSQRANRSVSPTHFHGEAGRKSESSLKMGLPRRPQPA